jgi:hypothetical protein
MDLVRNIFKSSSEKEQKEFSYKPDSPLGVLQEQIKHLENRNLSPLPSTKEAVQIHKNDISGILKKIIYHFDIVLMDKLRRNRSDSAFKVDDYHYWNFISKYFQIPSVKFINNNCGNLQTNSEKGLTWLYISISEKSLAESIREIYIQGFDKKFYEIESIVQVSKNELIYFSEKLCKFHLFNIKIGIEDEYNEYKKQKEIEGKEKERSEIDVPLISPINNRKKSLLQYVTPYNLDLKETVKKESDRDNFYYSKATLDLNLNSKVELPNEKNLRTIDNLFNIMNNEDDEVYAVQPDNQEEEDLELIREKSHAKNTQIIYSSVNKESNNANNYLLLNQNNYEDRIFTTLRNNTKNHNAKENYNVSKYFDFGTCYKEDFYLFINSHSTKNLNYKDNHNDRMVHPYKKEDYFESSKSTQTKTSKILHTQNMTNDYHSSSSPEKEKDLELVAINKNNIPFDKHFRVCRKVDKNIFTKKDIIFYRNKEVKMTNSIVFYLNHFYKKVPYIKFKTKLSSDKPITVKYF